MNSPRVAIIADDLTGALDVCAPFARRGLRCGVAVTANGVPELLGKDAEVVCVNTASREWPVAAARAKTQLVAALLTQARPTVAFQKIDSRLKGHVADAIEACMRGFGRSKALVAPAVPAQGRLVSDGQIMGKGVPEPIDIAGLLRALPGVSIADSGSDEDLLALAREHLADLLVGASGLGAGLAQALTDRGADPLLTVQRPMLMAIGSHDAVTLAQVTRLGEINGIASFETGDGRIDAALPSHGITLVRAVGDPTSDGHGAALSRFGLAVAEQLRSGQFASVLLCGGETAQTVLDAVGIACLDLLGEALPGIPVSRGQVGGRTLKILTKSGGFGTSDDLLRIAEVARPASSHIDPKGTGIPA